MALLSISEAARRAGVDRSTIQRAIKAGRVSATRDSQGRRCVDAAELGRVYGAVPQHAAGTPEAPQQADMVEVLQDQVEELRQDKVRLLALLEREQGRADTLTDQVEALRDQVRLLEGPRGEPERRSWWRRLVGK